MTENRKQKLVQAGTATAVVVFFFLIIILVYQFVSIGLKTKAKNDLIAERDRLIQEIDEGKEGVKLWQTKWKIEERARQLDYVYSKEKENEDEYY